MRFLADMGVDIRVVHWLRTQGHDAIHLRERGMHRASDADIFRTAAAEQRIILTFDLDFSDLAALAHDDRARVVVFRLANARAGHVITRLQTALSESQAALIRGVSVTVEEARHRIRCLPIGME